MRILVVDDEQPAREELRRLLADVPVAEVVGEAENAEQALEQIEQLHPDVVMLDIEMPGETGVEFIDRLEHPRPAVIYTTAYEHFAHEAFRQQALDYLLKPIEPKRLRDAIDRAVTRLTNGDGEEPGPRTRLGPDDRLFVRDAGRSWFAKVRQIRLLEADGNYTRLYIGGDKPMVYRALRVFEERLDPRHFFRANRFQIINLDEVEKVDFVSKDDMSVTLKCGTKIQMSRRMGRVFRDVMGL